MGDFATATANALLAIEQVAYSPLSTFFYDPGSSLAGILAHMNVAEVIPE